MQQLALAFTDAFLEGRPLPDGRLAAVYDQLGVEGVLELATELTSYLTFSKLRIALGLSGPPEGG